MAMTAKPFASALALMASSFAHADQGDAPLSAIDWLNETPTVTLDIGLPPSEPPIAQNATRPDISVDTLDQPGRDAVGLLPSHVTGLPASLWHNSAALELARLIDTQRPEVLPAVQALLYTLLLAEANPPHDAGTSDRLLQSRVDKLVELGAIEQANALLERADPSAPSLFARWFDVTLLLGQEDAACEALLAAPHLAPDYASRIFCTARSGDWNSAALMLDNANALGLVTDEQDALLLRFLDPEPFADQPILVAAHAPTPLTFRLYESIGEAHPTTTLPRPFAHADLRDITGWKARLESAERLARTGALHENRLLGIYSEGKPSASGMIWDRVDAIQSFDSALESRNLENVAATLPAAWAAMQSVHLEVPFASLFGARLLGLPLNGVTKKLARDIAFLSPDYERAARTGPRDFLAMLALGSPPRTPTNPVHRAISDGFHDARVPQEITTMLARGQLGEVILRAMSLMSDGAAGNLEALTDAIAIFRAVGLEDTARRAALQTAILDTRG